MFVLFKIPRNYFLNLQKKTVNSTIVGCTQSPSKKTVIPRLKQLSYGEVLTTADVLKRLKEAQQRKLEKTKKQPKKCTPPPETIERPKKRPKKPEKKGNIEKKRQKKADSSSSDDQSFKSDSESPWEEDFTENEEIVTLKDTPLSDLKNGDFVLVKFTGGKRNTTVYKYVCAVENVVLDNVQGCDIEVVALKSIDDTYQNFAINQSDVSFVSHEQILGVLPVPTINMKGERIFYHFEKRVPCIHS